MTACQSISANDSLANPNNAEALTQSQIAHNRQPKATPIMARSGYLADIKANDDAHKKVFDTLNDTSDAVAKQRFLTALNAHLSGKHTAVSQTRLQSEPYLQESDPNYAIDKGADSLLYSLADWVAKMMGDRYDNGDEDSEPAYRTYDDMLMTNFGLIIEMKRKADCHIPNITSHGAKHLMMTAYKPMRRLWRAVSGKWTVV